jgi:hypothetical protein
VSGPCSIVCINGHSACQSSCKYMYIQKIRENPKTTENRKIQKQYKERKNTKTTENRKIQKQTNRSCMIPSDPRGLQNVASLLLGSEELGCKIYISPSPLGRCILRIAAASPLYFTPYFKSRYKPSSPPGNCFVWPRGRGWSRWGALLALRLLPYSRPAPSPALRPPLPPR